MYVVIETWTPRPAFLAADEETRNTLFAGVREAMRQLAETGVVTLGWGSVDRPAPHSTPHEWFAVWQAPSKELADGFLDGVERSGWYTYFEQSNVVGELRSFEAVEAEHRALGTVAR
ncbi:MULTISPECIES: DUF6616 family protein [Streptomyces]|uniref:DUF6616 family protein n=1 Tax=Streptomyces milbemycinicus TaxID=476552 RepID=A0ABW8M786_9ACTN|nr:DUF6616 family protein [Streptomyces hygroscopicus]GLV75554.1 hypothetical protein Shyhy02_35540 [Streptomyces hygroscopicus subsp. hygroscopicus]